ncbi:ArsR/SmtB family transcription factor [Dyadobacter subterraneus]|uniref:Helix-turn-helix transcriptional regulator n=1 Tax=Dyadobacter subterraneus TaxID=2773304 RepID=A0ABR9WFY7_9BACT|nr:metalloregulator ArsR/SmtB family transcription factor [Dyadobacter subterraneus]MBE9464412.1 helix-turn-helix transcriptional regulator [Dyadobacter subterraneus]
MDHVEIFKALSNKSRLEILNWLKNPELHFDAEHRNCAGVCVGIIQEKSGLTQSTISEYLTILKRAGLIEATRTGQWTYYKRNEEAFAALSKLIGSEI